MTMIMTLIKVKRCHKTTPVQAHCVFRLLTLASYYLIIISAYYQKVK